MKTDVVKRVIIVGIVIIFLLIALFLFLLRRQILSYGSKNSNSVQIVYELDDYITIKNKLPLSDAIGKKYDGSLVEDGTESLLEFSIVNPNKDVAVYEIILTKNQITPREIPDSCIKLYLTDDRDMPMNGFDGNDLPLFRDLPYLSDMPSSKLLYTGIIGGESTQKFRLRAWLADHYAISGLPETFQFDVSVKNQ